MNGQELRKSFDEMVKALRKVPNVSEEMLAFTGHSNDIDLFGYFFYEGVLPKAFDNSLDAGRYILGVVLENDHDFEWTDGTLQHRDYNVSLDLSTVVIDESIDGDDADSAVDRVFEAITSDLAKRRIYGFPFDRNRSD